MKFNEIGRSMVEMLGVLAIIGVLSIGAIAGYQKAMGKYRMNRYSESLNMLLNTLLQMKDSLPREENNAIYYNELLYKMGSLPDGIEYVNESTLQEKWFKSTMTALYNNSQWNIDGNSGQDDHGSLQIFLDKSDLSLELCRTTALVAKENTANLWQLLLYQRDGSSMPDMSGRTYGDMFCTPDKKCLKDLTLQNIDDLCKKCEFDTCNLSILWKRS